MSFSLIDVTSKSTNNYCIHISTNNPIHCIQFDLLYNNIKKKYKELNVYFIVDYNLIKCLNLNENFITLDYFEKNKNFFSTVEEFNISPKINPVEEFCKKNDIDMCIDNQLPYSNGTKTIVYTKSYNLNKSLSENDLSKISRIFGNNLIINPDDTNGAKYVIGTECWQIFKSASKKIPTWVVSNKGNYVDLFLKMFPKQKKIEL